MTVRRSQTKHVTPEHANIQADEPDNILTLNIPARDFRRKQDAAYAEYQKNMADLLNDASGLVSSLVSDNELERFRPTMEELVARQKKITEDYYFKIRTMSAEDGGATLPEYVKVPDTDANRAMWKTVGGFAHTDFTGLKYRDVITGNNAAGKTMDDVWDLGYRKFPLDPNTMDYGPWEDLAHELLYNADRLHMTRLTEADPSQPRYARVPHGPACEFCIMLAGRGFVYRSSESAGGEFHTYHAHDHCSVIPSWNKQNLTHYDPEGMKERYEQCAATVQYLTTEALYERYVEAELEKQKDLKKEDQKWKTYSQWKRDIILAEMRTRSRDWLYDGHKSNADYSEKSRDSLKPHEQKIIDYLTSAGFAHVQPRKEININEMPIDEKNRRNVDSLINGDLWEFKALTSSNIKKIEARMNEARKQCLHDYRKPNSTPRVVLDLRDSELNDDDVSEEIMKRIPLLGYAEVLQICKDGSLRRLKNI